jgi:hypothetical protein
MIDIPESNSTGLTLAVRGLELAKREVQQNHTVSCTSTSTAEDWTPNWWDIALLVVLLWTTSWVVFALLPNLRRMIRRNPHALTVVLAFFPFLQRMIAKYPQCFTYQLNLLERLLDEPWSKIRFIRKLSMLGSLEGYMAGYMAGWAVVLVRLYKQQRWSTASEFLATCKMQQASPTSAYNDLQITNFKQENDFPVGEDCAKYLAKELKPPTKIPLVNRIIVRLSIIIGVLCMMVFLVVILVNRCQPRIIQLELEDTTFDRSHSSTEHWLESDNSQQAPKEQHATSQDLAPLRSEADEDRKS